MHVRISLIVMGIFYVATAAAGNIEITSNSLPGYNSLGSPIMVDTIEACRDQCAANKSCVRYFVKFSKDVQYSCILAAPDKNATISNVLGYSYYNYAR